MATIVGQSVADVWAKGAHHALIQIWYVDDCMRRPQSANYEGTQVEPTQVVAPREIAADALGAAWQI
jgi:hypothetical protein